MQPDEAVVLAIFGILLVVLTGALTGATVRRRLAARPLLAPEIARMAARLCWGLGLLPPLATLPWLLGPIGHWLAVTLLVMAAAASLILRAWLVAMTNGIRVALSLPRDVASWIVVDGRRYRLTRIGPFATEGVSEMGAELRIPNSALAELAIDTSPSATTAFDLRLRLAARSDARRAAEVIRAAVLATDGIDADPAPVVILEDTADGDLGFLVRARSRDADASGLVASAARMAILDALRLTGLPLAHAQHDVHLRDLDAVKAALALAMEERRQAQRNARDRSTGE